MEAREDGDQDIMQLCNNRCDRPPFIKTRPNYSKYYYCTTCEMCFPKDLGTPYCICCVNKARSVKSVKKLSPAIIRDRRENRGSCTKEDLKVWAVQMFGGKKR